MMRFFTQEWQRGDLSDAEAEAVYPAYQQHLDTLVPKLPATIRVLAWGINLHDGLIRQVRMNRPAATIAIELRCGDLQVGYFDLDLTYGDVDFAASDLDDLSGAARDVEASALYDEIDRGTGACWVHRISFSPEREIAICFEALELHVIPRSHREFIRPEEPFIDVGPLPATEQ